MKNILVLTGSPRQNGNSDQLADAFIKGASEAGHTVTKFETARARINGCKACMMCWSKGTPCIFKDDFNKLAEHLEKADTLVLASPLYWFTFSAQIKAAIDKFYSYLVPQSPKSLQITRTVLLMSAGDPDPSVFNGAIATYKLISSFLDWRNVGMITVPNVNEKDDILNTPFLKEAEQLGKNI